MRSLTTRWLLVLVMLGVTACTGGERAPDAQGVLDGVVVVTAPVRGAEVTAYAFDATTGVGAALATSAPTDETGKFHLELADYSGPLLLVARGTGATYVEPASGVPVAWDASAQLQAVYIEPRSGGQLVADFPLGASVQNVVISPWSDLVVTYGLAKAGSDGNKVDAIVAGYGYLSAHLKNLAFWSTPPADLTQPLGGWNDSVHAGLSLAGLSQLVLRTATAAQLSKAGLNTMQLLTLLERDIGDLFFDGQRQGAGGSETLALCPADANRKPDLCVLSWRTLSAHYGESVGEFLTAPANQSGITVADGQAFRDHVRCPYTSGGTSGNVLFRGDITCNPGDADSVAPTVFLEEVRPNGDIVPLQDATILTGTRQLRVRGVDSLDMGSLQVTFYREGSVFDADSFKTVQESAPDVQTLIQVLTINSLKASDGAYEIRVTATDQAGNVSAEVKRTLIIDNSDDGNVAGTVTIGGRVATARVRVLAYDNGVVGATIATGATDTEGVYNIVVPDTTARVLLVVADLDPLGSTTYVEGSSGATISLSPEDSIEAILTDWDNGESRIAQLTPWTHVASRLARGVWAAKGSNPALWSGAVESAYDMLEQHFGDGGPSIVLRDVVPSDLTKAGETNVTAGVRYGFIVTALGQLADKQALESGATPASMNTLTLTKKLAEDAGVCALTGSVRECLDGRGSGQLLHGMVPVTSYFTRDQLAIAGVTFLENNPRSQAPFVELDFAALLEVMAADDGFRGNDLPRLYPAADEPKLYDQIDPAVVFLPPSPAAQPTPVLRGNLAIKASATDNRALKSVVFSGEVVGKVSGVSLDTTNGTGMIDKDGPWVLTGTVATDQLAEGARSIDVTATDEANRAFTAKLSIIVDRTSPVVQITGATAGGVALPNGGTTGAATASVTGKVTDANLNSNSVTFKVGAGAATPVLLAADGTFTINVPLANGANVLAVAASDKAGNAGSASATYNRDATPPTVELKPATISSDETADLTPATGAATGITYKIDGGTLLLISGKSFTKFASNYQPTSTNLPVWQFAVADNVTAAASVVLKARLSRGGQVLKDWFVVPVVSGSGFNRAQMVSSGLHPDIATLSGTYVLEVQAFDQFDNASSVQSFQWTQTVKPPPVRQRTGSGCGGSDPACPTMYHLYTTAQNLTHRLIKGDAALPDGKVRIAAAVIDNPTNSPVRINFTVKAPTTYSVGARYDHVKVGAPKPVVSEGCNNGIGNQRPDGTCFTPQPTDEIIKVAQEAGDLAVDVLVLDPAGNVIPVCAGCSVNEREIPAGTSVNVYVRSTPWSFLWTTLGGNLASLGPVDAGTATLKTGEQTDTWLGCTKTANTPGEGTVCTQQQEFRAVRYLTRFRVDPVVTVSLQARPASAAATLGNAIGDGVNGFGYTNYGLNTSEPPATTF